MAEIQQFNLGQLLGQAEAIKGARRQNQLGELLQPLQLQEAQLGLQQARLGQTQQLAKGALAMMGGNWQDPEVWNRAITMAEQQGADVRPLKAGPTQERYNLIQAFAAGNQSDIVKGQMGAGVIVDIDGTQYFSNPIFDPASKTMKTELTPVAGGRSITVDADPSTGSVVAADGQPIGRASIVSKTTGLTPSGTVEQRGAESAAAERGKKGAGSRRVYMDEGLASSDGMSAVTRAMSLLRQVKTGGIQSTAGLRIRQMTGSESADEGELSGLLGKTVLSQLRTIFGAAFTQAEGQRLIEIEAGFGKNPETNMRLLQNAYNTMERAAERGIRAAEAEGDDFTASEIRRNLETAKAALEEAKQDDVSGTGAPAGGLTPEQKQRLEALRGAQR